MKLRAITIALIAAGVALTGTAKAISWNPSEWLHHAAPPAVQSTVATPTPVAMPARTSTALPISAISAPNYRAIVERYGSAVVGINTEGTAKSDAQDTPDAVANDPFFQFFRGIPGMRNGQMPHADVPVHGQGSGFIFSSDGLILTNAHVVRDADEVTVKLSNRREYKAKVVGSDKATDVAILKINATNLPVVSLGNPAQLGVGDYVLAIGSPFGFEQSATAGIVSAKGRSLPGDGYVPFIQTDVAVNPGNSGGPLFDASGNVVGINSQIYSQTGGYMGLSFAIPIDVALRVKDQILSTGKVVHARLGVEIQELTQALADSFKLTQPDGALVANVAPGSPAEKAGLQPGDVIIGYNTDAVRRSGDLPALVSAGKPGDKATLDVWRAGKKIRLAATLASIDDKLASNDDSPNALAHGKLGVAVRPLNADEKRQANVATGLIVEQVSGAAARAGIAAGDIILSVNGASVKSVAQLQAIISTSKDSLALLIERGDNKIFVPVHIG